MVYPKLRQFLDAAALRHYAATLGWDLPVDDQILTAEDGSPLAHPLAVGRLTAGNRWCIHPMEGWDGLADGAPSPLNYRRWQRFGHSGAKLIWGGEAAAVRADGRANPRQLLAVPQHVRAWSQLRTTLVDAHRGASGTVDDLVVGLQLTHSGRFARDAHGRPRPRIAYHHPLLDRKLAIPADDPTVVLTDDQLARLVDDYVTAAGVAYEAGFGFVDIKACHGYLVHELLSARVRPGRFGGDYEGRTRFLRTVIGRVRESFPQLEIGVRLSVFDTVPFEVGPAVGRPMDYACHLPYRLGFGVRADDPLRADLAEPLRLIADLVAWGVVAINVTVGSPYYNPHLQRPAAVPPQDGYAPPEDPLVSVCRQLHAARACRAAAPAPVFVGSGYSYLQDFLPHVAQAAVRDGWIDAVGLGRMVLAYPELPTDALRFGRLQGRRICRTLSDCTTAPRQGLVSGCYPLDPFYKSLPEAVALRAHKRRRDA